MELFIEQILKELPSGLGIALLIFLGILLILWILLPLWILFIHWNTGKIRQEIQNLTEIIEKRGWEEGYVSGPKD